MRALVALLSPHRWKGPLAEAGHLLDSHDPPPEGSGRKLDAWLASPAWELRNAAVKLIAHWRDEARYARLLGVLGDRAEAGIVRRNAAEALARLGLATPPARAALVRALADPYWEVRSEAALALAALFHPAEDLEQALLDALLGARPRPPRRIREDNFEVRMAHARALGHLGLSRAAFDALLALAGDDSWLVRSQAVVGIAHLVARQTEFFGEAHDRLHGVDRLSEGCVSFFVLRDVLGRVLRAVTEGPQALSAERLRALYLDPRTGWNRVRP
ncbi:MAG TPA: HEAT repeat domain-containing protein [Planctomycetota bacterium]|nr:HEAT repeat domain-containing protein [Planctomycetota bacterium]HRR79577.1 HEAT repeat domain-containing protein [Planctomycetota bacterium]HRT94419.1 HEAT repeat domain-containing protein [Planctomycetota bacterium]